MGRAGGPLPRNRNLTACWDWLLMYTARPSCWASTATVKRCTAGHAAPVGGSTLFELMIRAPERRHGRIVDYAPRPCYPFMKVTTIPHHQTGSPRPCAKLIRSDAAAAADAATTPSGE